MEKIKNKEWGTKTYGSEVGVKTRCILMYIKKNLTQLTKPSATKTMSINEPILF